MHIEIRMSGKIYISSTALVKSGKSRPKLASLNHVIPVKKTKENDFSMEFSASSKSQEIDRLEGFYRILSIFRAAFDATSPSFLSALVHLPSDQCFGFA